MRVIFQNLILLRQGEGGRTRCTSYEITQIFEFDVGDARPTNVHKISSLIFLHIYFNFMEKGSSSNFRGVFDHLPRSNKVRKF